MGWIAGCGEWGGLRGGVDGVGCVVGLVAGCGEMGWVAWWGGWVRLQHGVNGVDCRMG